MPKISVFMPSHNKGGYVVTALRSIENQTRQDFEVFVLENSTDDGRTKSILRKNGYYDRPGIRVENIEDVPRGEVNVMGWLLNRWYPKANGEYIFYLSDDDLLMPRAFQLLAGHLDDNPDHGACYGTLQHANSSHPSDMQFTGYLIMARDTRGPGEVDCHVDGGQIMHRKSCLDDVGYPYFEESPELEIARHIDGMFMERLVRKHPLHPVDSPEPVATHRMTPKSTYTRSS